MLGQTIIANGGRECVFPEKYVGQLNAAASYIMVVNGYYSPNGWTPFGRNKAFRAGPCRKLRRISPNFKIFVSEIMPSIQDLYRFN